MASRVSPFDIQDSSVLDDELSTFCTNLETIQNKFLDEWISTWKEGCEQKIAENYEKAIIECEGDIKKLEEDKRDQNLRQAQMREATDQLEKIRTQKEMLWSKCSEKETKLKEQLDAFEIESTDVNALEKVTAAKKGKILKALSFFKQRLGLEFKNLKGEEQIKIIFTNIDECDPERQFTFNTKIEQSRYLITCCSPPVKELDDYIDELNKSNNFSRFVINMRKAFRKSLAESKENHPPS